MRTDKDDELFVLEIDDHAVVSHSVLPEGPQRTGERLSQLSGVGERRDAPAQKSQNADLDLSVELGKLALCPWVNRIDRAKTLDRPDYWSIRPTLGIIRQELGMFRQVLPNIRSSR